MLLHCSAGSERRSPTMRYYTRGGVSACRSRTPSRWPGSGSITVSEREQNAPAVAYETHTLTCTRTLARSLAQLENTRQAPDGLRFLCVLFFLISFHFPTGRTFTHTHARTHTLTHSTRSSHNKHTSLPSVVTTTHRRSSPIAFNAGLRGSVRELGIGFRGPAKGAAVKHR